jgi:hypothetical protein
MTTPVPRIWVALEGRMDFLKKTNPFGGGDGTGARKAGTFGEVIRRSGPPTEEERRKVAAECAKVFG